MNSSAKSNIFEVSALSVAEVYGDFLSLQPGSSTASIANTTLLVGTSRKLSPDALTALAKSAQVLGFGSTFTLLEMGGAAEEPGAGAAALLGANDVLTVTEGLDPLAVVLADEAAGGVFGRAYRTTLEIDGASRVLGRTVVAFRNLDELMGDSAGKQKAWALLKKLV